MDATGAAALVTATSSAILGFLAYVSGRRKNTRHYRDVTALRNSERNAIEAVDPLDIVTKYQSLVGDLESDRAHWKAEAEHERNMRVETELRLGDRDRELASVKRRLARYEGVEDTPPPRSRRSTKKGGNEGAQTSEDS